MAYIDYPIDSDPQDILSDAYAYLQSVIPGWDPSAGQLDVWLLEAISSSAAELRTVASSVPADIFRWFGANLINLPPIDATAATSTITINVVDNRGYTIPDGTQVSIDKTGSDSPVFTVVGDQTIAVGTTSKSGIPIVAVDPGADSSAAGTVGGVVNLQDPLAFVTSMTLDAITSGGVDAELDTDYLNRLAAQLQLLAPRPILANDFAVFARSIPGVFRSTAIDGYNPGPPPTSGNARTVSVAAIDSAGNPVSSAIKAAVIADLQARREVNFQVFVVDPTLNYVDITYTVKALVGYDPTTLVASINADLRAYLNPSTWGVLAGGDPHDWANITTVRYLEIAQIINDVAGVDYITTTAGNYDLTIGIHGGALARTDLVLTGVAPLPSAVAPAVITGTAT